jgi:TrmH family RNA methyltransferase
MYDHSHSAASIHKVLARVRRLGQRRYREIENRLWVEGVRNFVQAADAGIEFDTILISPILLKSSLVEKLTRRLFARGAKRVRVSPEQFRSVSATAHASGIAAIVKHPWVHLDNVDPHRGIGWLVLEDIRSPGNLGTILRTAEACGISGIVFLGPRCDPFDPTVVRASMGGIFHLQLVRTNHERLKRWAGGHGIRLAGLSPDAGRLWTELPEGGSFALVVGEERHGMSDVARAMCEISVRLPMSGVADSINVGVAAGVMMYEMVRRQSAPGDCERLERKGW